MNDSPGTDPAPDTAPAAAPELFTWEFATDPYPAYAWLREHSPVHRTKLPSGVEAWLVTRYADARQALADTRLSKNPAHHAGSANAKGKTGIPGERKAELMTHLLNIDPRTTPGCAGSCPRRSPRAGSRSSHRVYRS